MRTMVTIVGCGERRSGTGKNGKPYDFVSVAFTYKDKHMNGFNAGSCNIDGNTFEQYQLRPGSEIEVVLMFRNYQPYIVCVL